MIPEISNKDLYEHCHLPEDEGQTEEEDMATFVIPHMVVPDTPNSSIATPVPSLVDTTPPSPIQITDTEETNDDAQTEEKKTPIWLIALIILYMIGEIIMFIPLLILSIMGITSHPFLSYILFRDAMRRK